MPVDAIIVVVLIIPGNRSPIETADCFPKTYLNVCRSNFWVYVLYAMKLHNKLLISCFFTSGWLLMIKLASNVRAIRVYWGSLKATATTNLSMSECKSQLVVWRNRNIFFFPTYILKSQPMFDYCLTNVLRLCGWSFPSLKEGLRKKIYR